MDHTIERLMKVQEQVLTTAFPVLNGVPFTLISKWRCDGSSGHSQYKQTFADENYSDEYIFIISLFTDYYGRKKIVWQNHKTSSSRLCCPIKFVFAKESTTLIKDEVQKIEDQIRSLQPIIVNVGSEEISITHSLVVTMID